jgi:hypothetical protein
MARKRPTGAEGAALLALFGNLPAKIRRLVLHLLWEFTPCSERAAPALRVARAFADKGIKAQIRAAAATPKKGRA